MSGGPLHVAFTWHMHQPYYKDLVTGRYALPWVRLHGIKDYYDMANILRDFPDVRQTFNLVPSLIDQVIDYCEDDAPEIYLEHSIKPASSLDATEKVFILRNFFLANWDNMIKPYPRYWELLNKRGANVSATELNRLVRYFSDQDFIDLQVWFNLAWFDPMFRETDKFLKGLVEKGRDFSEDDKGLLIAKQRDVLRLIIPEYKSLWESGQIEIAVSPYYHPILPLLCDTESAWEASPGMPLPRRFMHPEDATAQVSRAVERFREIFGKAPVGMWPSEGSVGKDMIPVVAGQGIKWIATDEEVLAQSVGSRLDRDFAGITKKPELLYRPYKAVSGGHEVDIVFRDHSLSDLFGFVYSKWDPKNAVEDFVGRLKKIRATLQSKGMEGFVNIILDGENAWEYYRNDGRDFLLRLYERLSTETELDITTVGGYLGTGPEVTELPKLHAGSWINHNFNIWIGQEEDNAAWDALSAARAALVAYERNGVAGADPNKLKMAWEEIYIAEGSDWCWWYGTDHSSENDREFDELFRKHLSNIYTLIEMVPPDNLMIPIIQEDRLAEPTVGLSAFISPTLDGEVTSYYEWLAAAYYDVSKYGGTMHRAQSIISHIYYGFDLENFFIRLDSNLELGEAEQVKDLLFTVHFLKPEAYRVEVTLDPEKGEVSAMMMGCQVNESGNDDACNRLATIAARDIIEMAVPFARIEAKPKDEVRFFVTVKRDEIELEKWPYRGYISFTVPTPEFEAIMWHV